MVEFKTLPFTKIKEWEDPREGYGLHRIRDFFKKSLPHLSGNNKGFWELYSTMFLEKHDECYYGSCWSLVKESDSMWRNYSDGDGVKIRTTTNKLNELDHIICFPEKSEKVLDEIKAKKEYPRILTLGPTMNFTGKVQYCSILDKQDLGIPKSDPRYFAFLTKRNAFKSEKEVRKVI